MKEFEEEVKKLNNDEQFKYFLTDIAKKLIINNKMSLNEISSATGISLEKLRNLKIHDN